MLLHGLRPLSFLRKFLYLLCGRSSRYPVFAPAGQGRGNTETYPRYFLLKYFNISTSNDDPDEFRRRQREAEAEEDRVITEGILQTLDKLLKDYLTSASDKREEVKAIVKKYVKSGDYMAIKESMLATKLLQESREFAGAPVEAE